MKESGVWVVYSRPHGVNSFVNQYYTEADAIACAVKLTTRHSEEHLVAKLVVRVKPVQQPTFEIERV